MTQPQTTRILQIVPRLYPDVDGVGDYSLQLARELRDRHQILSEFLVFRPSSRVQSQVDQFVVHALHLHTVEGLLEKTPTDISTLVLQYSNYPYLRGKLDAPTWLVTALQALKNRGHRLLVMFHELPTLRYRAIRCPNPVQRRVSRRLAQVADVVVTNNTAFQQTLARWVDTAVHCMPNFSTVGEPSRVSPLIERPRALIIFGSSDRGRIYRDTIQSLKEVCQCLDIHTVYDMGRPLDWDSAALEAEVGVTVIKTGFLPAAAVSELMLHAFAGIFDYHRFPNNLAKSTVYAAYCAHGLLPLCNRRPLPSQDGIIPNQHYLDTTTLRSCAHATPDLLPYLEEIADNAYARHRSHTLISCAKTFAYLVGLCTVVPPLLVDSAR